MLIDSNAKMKRKRSQSPLPSTSGVKDGKSRKEQVHYKIPEVLISAFASEAMKNKNENGKVQEIFGLVIGKYIDNELIAEDLIYLKKEKMFSENVGKSYFALFQCQV
jgi:hypothetical protein